MAIAAVFTGFDQTGSVLSKINGDPGRYGRVPVDEMLAGVSSTRIFAGAGATAIILFRNWETMIWDPWHMASFHGEFLQLANGTPKPWDVSLNQTLAGLNLSDWNNSATSMLVVRTEDQPEQRLSFAAVALQTWNDFFDQSLAGKAERVGNPRISWHAFSDYGAGTAGGLHPDRIYILIHQRLSVILDGWSDYEAWIKYWIRPRADGTGGVVAGVRRYEYWVESGLFSSVVAAILEPNLQLGAIEIENRLNTALAALPGGVTDVYLLPGTQTGLAASGTGMLWSETEGDVTVVIQR